MADGAASSSAAESLASVATGLGQLGKAAAETAWTAASDAGRTVHNSALAHGVGGHADIAYSPAIIQSFAAMMYRRAFWVVVVSTGLGIVAGLVLGGILSAGRSAMGASSGAGPALLSAIILGGLGFWIGQQKAFWLKFAAQCALCQAQIEVNTRRS